MVLRSVVLGDGDRKLTGSGGSLKSLEKQYHYSDIRPTMDILETAASSRLRSPKQSKAC